MNSFNVNELLQCYFEHYVPSIENGAELYHGFVVLARIHSEKKPRSQIMNFLVNEEGREKSRKLKDRNKVHKLFRRHFKVDF